MLRTLCACLLVPASLLSGLMGGCAKQETFDPGSQFPAWAFDAPHYARPAADTEIDEHIGNFDGDATHYYVRNRVVPIARPGSHNPNEVPRIGVWATGSNGFVWKRAGYFGIDQTHFMLVTDQDGAYGIRFVGPGQPVAKTNPPMPTRVYHVDTQPPQIAVFVEPADVYYVPNQLVKIHWQVRDPHLPMDPVRLTVQIANGPDVLNIKELDRSYPAMGTEVFTIPAEAVFGQFRVKVTALDRAGNEGYGFSDSLQVMPADVLPSSEPPATAPENLPEPPGMEQPSEEFPTLPTGMRQQPGPGRPVVARPGQILTAAASDPALRLPGHATLLAGSGSIMP